MQLFGFSLDVVVVLFGTWLWVQAAREEAAGALELLLSWGVCIVAVVAGSGVCLGAGGYFSASGFLYLHIAVLAAIVAWRQTRIAGDWQEARVLLERGMNSVRGEPLGRYGLLAVATFLLVTALLAWVGEPGIYDSLTYRLSRIGHWLQEGRIGFMATNDPRQNYMPIVPDVVMAWLLGGVGSGYLGAALAQWGGGGLLLAATVGLARQVGLERSAALGAALLVAGCANVAPQFTTTQTDLFTAGLVAAAFYLWRASAQRGRGSIVAGVAGGLALGAKGTVFYFLPTLALWALWYGWQHRLPIVAWLRTGLAGVAGVLIFAAPGLLQNWRHYGGCFGPAEFVRMHHQGGGGQWGTKVGLNLESSFIQLLEPHSQMPGVAWVAGVAARGLVEGLPESDPFTFENANRRAVLVSLMNRRTPDADATTFGLAIITMFVAGGVAGMGGRRGAREVRVMVAGVGVFLFFFHAMQQWHAYGFRYFILIAPWVGVVAAWWLEGLGKRVRNVGWGVALLAAVIVGGQTLTQAHNAGWATVMRADRSINSYVFRAWRAWIGELDIDGQPLQVALPFNRELAPFYRLDKHRTVRMIELKELEGLSAEQAVARFDQGWLITTPQQFEGNEGSVVRHTWLFRGEAASVYSLTAYRVRRADEAH